MDELTLLSWNLGYAGLGKESDFVIDGGTAWLAPSKALVEKNLSGITQYLHQQQPDVFLLQEVAKPSLVNRRVDVLESVTRTLPHYQRVYMSDFRTRWIPPPFNVNVGLAVFVRQELRMISHNHELPLEPRRMLFFRKHYQCVVNRIPTGHPTRQWVIINIHLAAFDEKADIRKQQLAVLRELAAREFEEGHYVIIGGDWNMRLVETHFSHTTNEEHLFWIQDMPDYAFPDGWQIVADPVTPSVRTNYQPYIAGENYVGVIDGFVASPNVRVQSVETTDLQFEYSDHQPVAARFTANIFE
jgi:endonuclease/exonuclease/phosphatase family metal-dependent hydrolase